ncbi:MAG: hypothetical protein ACI4SS_01920 [Clostridia bacterium]
MKKKILSLALAALLAFSVSGCGKKIRTELPMENIRSMMINAYGDLYLLTDLGIRYYALSSDKEVDYIYSSDELSEAELDMIIDGEEIVYSGLKVERIMAAGEDGVTMAGRYMNNTAGHDRDLFVLQDAADLNYGAAYFSETERDSKAKTSVLNGMGITDNAVYFKLNRAIPNKSRYDSGISCFFNGTISAFEVPDDVTGAVEKEGKVYFLTENKNEVKIVADGETVMTFDRAQIADAFVSGGSIYAVYKSGKVTKWDVGGEETEFMDLGTKLGNVNDAVLWDGQLYWFDKDGVKTVK